MTCSLMDLKSAKLSIGGACIRSKSSKGVCAGGDRGCGGGEIERAPSISTLAEHHYDPDPRAVVDPQRTISYNANLLASPYDKLVAMLTPAHQMMSEPRPGRGFASPV